MNWLINGFQVPLIVQHKQVKGINIRVTWDGKVVVSVPVGASDEIVKRVLERKADWVLKKLEEMETRRKQLPLPYKFVDGETFWILGKPVILYVFQENSETVKLIESKLIVKITEHNPERVKEMITKWYQEKTLETITEKIDKFARILEVEPRGIEIKDLKREWALCDTKNNILKFNWKLIQLPEDLIEYILVHELTHLIYPRHEQKFWSTVKKIIADYKQRHNKLKDWVAILQQ